MLLRNEASGGPSLPLLKRMPFGGTQSGMGRLPEEEPSEAGAELAEQLLALKRALSDGRASAEARLARALSLVEGVGCSAGAQRCPATGGLAPWQIRKVSMHIAQNIDGPLRNGELAAVARLTTSHFSRAFRASVGIPPHEYVIQRRIERAKALMLSTDTPLGQIALDCGLSDQAHLSRLFVRLVGESPRSWRRNRQEGWNQAPADLRATA